MMNDGPGMNEQATSQWEGHHNIFMGNAEDESKEVYTHKDRECWIISTLISQKEPALLN